MSTLDRLDSADRRTSLEALRALLAVSLVDAEPGQRAPLAKQLRDTLAELDALPDGKEVSTSDDLASRRSARRSAAKSAAHPAASDI